MNNLAHFTLKLAPSLAIALLLLLNASCQG